MTMKCSVLTGILLVGLFSSSGAILWDAFSITFPAAGLAEGNRFPLPRTAPQAHFDDVWVPRFRDLGCKNQFRNGFQYNGYAFSHPDEPKLTILYDANGIVAGLQLWVLQDEVLSGPWGYRFDYSPVFQNVTLRGEYFFVITVYFVDPAYMCTESRSEKDLATIGTAEGLWFQVGKTPASTYYVSKDGPMKRDWIRDSCIPGQGHRHFYRLDEWQDHRCDNIQPPVLLTDGYTKDLIGFGLIVPGQTPKSLDGRLVDFASELGPRRSPKCWDALIRDGEVTMWRVLFVSKSWLLACPRREQSGRKSSRHTFNRINRYQDKLD